jgi:saccharopine dehydrogenase-like NADP-dependent oxidoreductase
MVKIAIAGGSGEVAREVLDVLVASKRHEIVILSRSVSLTPYFLR